MENPLLAVDAPWLLYRGFFSLPETIVGKDNQPVNAVLGATNAILFAIEKFSPRAVVTCFGPESAEYRVRLFSGYHANRPPLPNPLDQQFLMAADLWESLDWYVSVTDKFEADDLLGSYAQIETNKRQKTLILTADRDLYQCVNKFCSVLHLRSGRQTVEITPDAVREIYGIGPEIVPDFIALRGDPSDGIPGAKGIGAKTAAELLRRYGSLEAVLANREKESPRINQALATGEQQLRIFKEVALLQMIPLTDLPTTPTNFARGSDFAQQLGMNGLAKRLLEQI